MKHDPSWITKESISERLSYDQDTGLFAWKVCRYASNIGKVTNSLDAHGYVQIKVRGTVCKAHRLAWLMTYGEMPANQIDHINRNRSDNRICNLRLANNSENSQNRSKQRNNTSGCIGICWVKRAQKWRAYIVVNKKQIHLGFFSNLSEAIDARKAAEPKHHKFNHKVAE